MGNGLENEKEGCFCFIRETMLLYFYGLFQILHCLRNIYILFNIIKQSFPAGCHPNWMLPWFEGHKQIVLCFLCSVKRCNIVFPVINSQPLWCVFYERLQQRSPLTFSGTRSVGKTPITSAAVVRAWGSRLKSPCSVSWNWAKTDIKDSGYLWHLGI